MPRIAIFFDRDGVLNEEVGHIAKASDLRVYPFAAEAVRRVNETGVLAIVVTNQSGIARGLLSEASLKGIHDRLEEVLDFGGARLDDIYYCPHHPEYGTPQYRRVCNCRKPNPGMLFAAARDHEIDLTQSTFVTDRHREIAMAQMLGLQSVLVLTGYGRSEREQQGYVNMPRPDLIAEDVLHAVQSIVSGMSREKPNVAARRQQVRTVQPAGVHDRHMAREHVRKALEPTSVASGPVFTV